MLQALLKTCEEGKLQLPDFQRSWVWEEERIMSLIDFNFARKESTAG